MEYEKKLAALREYLREPRTVAEVAEHFGCSRFAAYERVTELARRLGPLAVGRRETGTRGVRPMLFQAPYRRPNRVG